MRVTVNKITCLIKKVDQGYRDKENTIEYIVYSAE